MRRSIPPSLDATAPLRNPDAAASTSPGLDVTLTLRTLTPIVGGGVEALTPDDVDVVRVPGIRGHLRSFWRALGDETDQQALRLRERDLWGGVGEASSTTASKVRVDVEVTDRGITEPAGFHTLGANGRLRAFAEWSRDRSVNQALGYALFPLQIDEKERATYQGQARVPTRTWHRDVTFRLRLRCPGEPDTHDRLLGALWWWIHFGGLGARTSRGFGALAIVPGTRGLPEAWTSRFDPPSRAQLPQWLADAPAPTSAVSRPWRTLNGHELLFTRRAEHTPERAHIAALAALREFRQGLGFGRAQGNDRKEGESYWPEAHMLRFVAEARWGATGRWPHPPPRGREREYRDDSGQWLAPRAAFGFPLGVQFKDPGDRQANGWIHGSRFPSPLRLRPLALKGDEYVAACLFYEERPPRGSLKVTRKMSDEHDAEKSDWKMDPGRNAAGAPLRPFLAAGGGDAVKAFMHYLVQRQGFERVPGGPERTP